MIDDAIARLVANGYGVLGTTIFASSRSNIPAGDGPFTSLTETTGPGPTFVHNASTPALKRPSCQVLIRAKTYPAAYAKAILAYALLTVRNTTVNGVFYLSMTPTQEPFDVGLDDQGRAMVAFNVMAEQRPS